MKGINLLDNESLNYGGRCVHKFEYQANVKDIQGIIWDVFYCERCLMHVKKERPCPMNLEKIESGINKD